MNEIVLTFVVGNVRFQVKLRDLCIHRVSRAKSFILDELQTFDNDTPGGLCGLEQDRVLVI